MQESVASTWFYKVRNSGACQWAGLVDFHFHDLRHTFASWLVMAGVPLATVSTLLGHKSLSMTMRSAHLPPKHMLSAVRVLDGQKSRSLDNHLAVSGLEGRDEVETPASAGT